MEQQIRIWQSISWKSVSDRTKDLIIALIISSIGIIGTYLILGKSIRTDTITSTETSNETSNIFSSNPVSPGAPKSSNEDLLIIQGQFTPNQILKISFMNYVSNKKYMIDYGNGIRQIVRSASSYVKYQESGIYYLLFYEMIEDKWEIVSSQAITIK